MRNKKIQKESNTHPRPRLTAAFFAAASLWTLFAQQGLPGSHADASSSANAGTGIPAYLAAQVNGAWELDTERARRWSRIRSESQLAQEKTRLRQGLLREIGGLPERKSPLKPRITGTVQREGFHIDKLVFQSLPHVYVTALVYVPEDGRERHPAVLVAAGHASDGKVHYQDLCQRLVLRGYVVVSWDPVGQGERSQFWDAAARKSRYNLISGEHAVLGRMAILRGQSLARYEVWDGIRALDYLLTRLDVDRKHVAIAGTSGGGFQAAMIGAIDTRISVIIPSCYITAMPMRMANRIFRDPDSDPEQDPAGFLSDSIDHAGLLLMMYPRRVMIAAATLDFFPVEGTRKSFEEVRAFYRLFGHGENIQMVESYNEHQFSLINQLAALRFLAESWHQAPPSELPPVVKVPGAELLCTRSGQVATEFDDSVSLQHILTRIPVIPVSVQALRYAYRRGPLHRSSNGSFCAIACLTSLEDRGEVSENGVRVRTFLLHYGDGLSMPLHYLSKSPAASATTVLLPQRTQDAGGFESRRVEELVDQGFSVIVFSFRAEGENALSLKVHGDDANLNPGSWQDEYNNPLSSVLADLTYNSLLLGRPYLLDRIEDFDLAMRFARSELGITDFHLDTNGDAFFGWAATGGLRLKKSGASGKAVWTQTDDESIEDTVAPVLLERYSPARNRR